MKALIQGLYILFYHFVYGHAGFPEDAIFSKAWFKRRAIVETNSIDDGMIKLKFATTANIGL